MRLKNVKGAKEIIESSSYVIHNPKEEKCSKLFSNKNPIQIEIGMGKGDFLIEHAKRNPNINYIGIEKFDSVLVRAVQKLEGIDLPNLKLIRMDAEEIEECFQKEIDTLYLNFSDPWPKKRHSKRRLTSPYFLKKYDSIFKGEKQIIMKTDNRELFEFSLISFNEEKYEIKEVSLDLYQNEEYLKNNVPTEYEKKFVLKGFPIYYVKVVKK